jgi:FtsZ-binding cell division protein ZapB
MDYAELDKLETNIERVIETIQKLQSENQRLKQENHNLLNRIREYERKIEQLKDISQDDGDLADQIYIFKEKEGKIKQKIQQILEKLEAFQDLSIND